MRTPEFEVLSLSLLSDSSFEVRSLVLGRLAELLRWLRKSTQKGLILRRYRKNCILRRTASSRRLGLLLGRIHGQKLRKKLSH